MPNPNETVEVRHVRALRTAGRALVVAVVDPKKPGAVKHTDEVLIPMMVIDRSSSVQKPGDVGTLVVPRWLALDRHLIEEGE